MIPKTCNDCGYCVQAATTHNDLEHRCMHDHGDKLWISPDGTNPYCPIQDDELPARRFKVQYRDQKLYVLVAMKNNTPYEVFAEHPTNRDPTLHYMMSSIDTMTRLATMTLKKYPLQSVINQISKSSRTKGDFSDSLASILLKCAPHTTPVEIPCNTN